DHHEPFHGQDVGEQHFSPRDIHGQQLSAVDDAQPALLRLHAHRLIEGEGGHAALRIEGADTEMRIFGIACAMSVFLSLSASAGAAHSTAATSPIIELMSADQSMTQKPAPAAATKSAGVASICAGRCCHLAERNSCSPMTVAVPRSVHQGEGLPCSQA